MCFSIPFYYLLKTTVKDKKVFTLETKLLKKCTKFLQDKKLTYYDVLEQPKSK